MAAALAAGPDSSLGHQTQHRRAGFFSSSCGDMDGPKLAMQAAGAGGLSK